MQWLCNEVLVSRAVCLDGLGHSGREFRVGGVAERSWYRGCGSQGRYTVQLGRESNTKASVCRQARSHQQNVFLQCFLRQWPHRMRHVWHPVQDHLETHVLNTGCTGIQPRCRHSRFRPQPNSYLETLCWLLEVPRLQGSTSQLASG